MSEILLCNRPVGSQYLKEMCGIDTKLVFGLSDSNPLALSAYKPYVYDKELAKHHTYVMSSLSAPRVPHHLTDMSLSFGGDNTVALAKITKKLQEFGVGMIGASSGLYTSRMDSFTKAVTKYQEALLAYRDVAKSKGFAQHNAKLKVLKAYEELQVSFRNELNTVNAGIRSNRGTVLSNPQRGLNIARSSRNIAKLSVTSGVHAHELVKFSRHSRREAQLFKANIALKLSV